MDCGDCKYLIVIISQMGDYYCYKKKTYPCVGRFISDCEDFTLDEISLDEKEEKAWG